MDPLGSGTSAVRPTTSSEVVPCVGEKGTDELKTESPKATINEGTHVDHRGNNDSSERHSQHPVTSLVIYSYSSINSTSQTFSETSRANEVAPGRIPTHQPPTETAHEPSPHSPKAGKESTTGEEHARAVQQTPPVPEDPEIVNIDDLEADDIVIAYVLSLNGEMSNVTFLQVS